MRLLYRTLAAICTVAVGLGSGCRSQSTISRPADDYISPLVTLGSDSYDKNIFTPEYAAQEDHSAVQATDCSITFASDSIGIRGEGAAIKGKDLVLSDGSFELSGESDSARIIIDGDKPVTILLNGLILNGAENIIEHRGTGTLTIALSKNSDNRITADGCGIYSSGDITFNGSGRLDIRSNGNGIYCGNTVKLCGGDISIKSEQNGIVSDRSIIASAGSIDIESGRDGLRTEYNGSEQLGYINITGGSIDIKADHNGINANKGVFISGGTTSLTCGGGSSAVLHSTLPNGITTGKHGGFSTDGSSEFDFSSMISGDGSSAGSKKGIRSDGIISMQNGVLTISSADDAISAKSDIVISDITLNISTGDDAIYSHSAVFMMSGTVSVSKSFNAIEGMLVDIRSGDIALSSMGSCIAAAGGADVSAWSSSDSSARYISISGGDIDINSDGCGLDSAGMIAVSGGSTTIFSDNSRGSVDYRDYFTVSNGTLAAFGASGSAKAPNLVSGSCISVYLKIESGQLFRITDSSSKELFTAALPKPCGSVIFYSSEITAGSDYLLYADNEQKTKLTAQDGVFGGGPDGSGSGVFDDVGEGVFNDNEIAA